MPEITESRLSTKQQIESIWKLGGLSPRQLTRRVYSQIGTDYLMSRASDLAYNFLLAAFPMLLFLISLFGLFASQSKHLQASLFFYLSHVLPPDAFTLVQHTLSEIIRKSGGGKLAFGLVFAIWAGSGGMSSLMSALNIAYGVKDSRSWIAARFRAIGLTIAISALIIAALFIVLYGGSIAEYVGGKLGLADITVLAWKTAQWLIALGFVILSFALIYYYGPDLREQHWYWITPGSLAGVILWLAVSFVFRVYLHFFNSYGKTYGSLGAVIILLFWFYVTGFAFLIGGEINSEIEHAAAERGHPEAKPEGRKAA
ncbi:MAG TPA: YihY/virulence factor BrkB family protein [Terriglobales bacterium]|nr:YihY/virulence factor BrkB family protein [Terriglobales bacterium]